MKMNKSIRILFFLFFLFGISLLNGLKKDATFSEFENRPLAQFPKFTLEGLANGTFTAEFESYVSDQFIGKTFWTGLKAKAEQAVLKQDNNGVYFAKDEYLLEKPKEITEQLKKNIDSVNQFQAKNKDFPITLVLAPTSIDVYPEKLPAFAKTGKHKDILDQVKAQLDPGIRLVDPLETLTSEKAAQIYFRTDHHWTTRGAFYSYLSLAKEMEFQPYSLKDFQIEEVSDTFYGTFYAKANDLSIRPDSIERFTLDEPFTYEIVADDQPKKDHLYEESFLEKRDQYAYFLGGNHAQTVITSSVNNGKKLLVLKDSYAHAFIPLLANHFEEIHMLDLRYYRTSIQAYIQKHGLTEGLILYNSPNFAADSSILYMKY